MKAGKEDKRHRKIENCFYSTPMATPLQPKSPSCGIGASKCDTPKWNDTCGQSQEERREGRRSEATPGEGSRKSGSCADGFFYDAPDKISDARVCKKRWKAPGHEPDAKCEGATWVSGKKQTRGKLGRCMRDNRCGLG